MKLPAGAVFCPNSLSWHVVILNLHLSALSTALLDNATPRQATWSHHTISIFFSPGDHRK